MSRRMERRFIPRACLGLLLAGMSASVRAQSPQLAPDISLAANERVEAQSYQGWALIFTATLFNPQRFMPTASVTPLVINPQNGSWANTIQLVVTDSNGATQNWPIVLIAPAPGSLTLDAFVTGKLAWVLGPADTSAIAGGTYTVTATLDTTSSAGTTGWSGTTGDSVSVQIGAPPSPATIGQQEEQAELLVTYDHLLGNDSQALADVSTFLNQQPSDIGALALKGSLLEQMGRTADALAAYNQAAAAFFVAHLVQTPEPPDHLLIPQNRAQAALFSQAMGHGQPQAAIQVAGQGVQSPGVFFLDLQITNVGNDVAGNVVLNQITFQTLSGAGQITFNNVPSPRFPVGTDFLAVNGSATIRVFVSVQGTVGDVSVTENGTAADIFGTPTSFSQTQTIFLNGAGGGPVPLTITAPNATQGYGQPTPPLNNVTYSGFANGDTAASLNGTLNCITTVTSASSAGTYPITCSGQTSPNYVITYVPGTLTITPDTLTITAQNGTRQYGQPNPPLNNVTYAGFVNGDTPASLSGTLACSTSATLTSPVGTFAITCSGLSSLNYSISFAQGILAITAAPLTITANNIARQYGSANPPLNNATYIGFVNGDSPSSLGGSLNCVSAATQASPVGAYSITCSGLTSANYATSFVLGMLTITPAVVTIAASNATKVLNAPNPVLTWTASGFVNSDTTSVLAANPTCSTTALTNSPVGSYPIACVGASAANYTFSYIAGNLKVQYAPAIGHVIQPPINPDGSSVFKQGRTIPAKFSVYDANGVSIGTPGVVSSFFLTGIVSGTTTTTMEDIVDTNNPDTAFRWDPTNQQWIFNITTANLSAGSTYIYTIALNDGSTIVFHYGLR